MSIIECGEFPDAIQWDTTGTAFGIQPETFSSKILEHYFQGCKFGSFSRKLSRWGFARTLGECPLQGRYCVFSHDLFQKDKPHLLERFSSRSAAFNKSLQTKKTRAVPPAAEAGMANSQSISARKPEPVARGKVPFASTPQQRADGLQRLLQMKNPTAKQASANLLLQQAAATEALNQRRANLDSMALLRSNNLLASMRSNASLGSFGLKNQLSASSLGNMGQLDPSVSRNQFVATPLGGRSHLGSFGRGSQLSLSSLGSVNDRKSQVPLGANSQSAASSVESNLQSYLGVSRQSLALLRTQSMQRSLGTGNIPLPSLGNNPSLSFPGSRINSLASARSSTLLPQMRNPSVASHVDGPSSSVLFSHSGFPSPSQAGNIQLNQALASSRPIPHPGSLLLSEAPTPLLLAALSRSYSATGAGVSVRTAPVLHPASTSQVYREVNGLSAHAGNSDPPINNPGHNSEDSDGDPDMEATSNLKVGYHAQRWRARFQELCHFVQKHGHSLVPQHKHGKNVELARWVKRQRYQYKLMVDDKESNMTPERVEALESIGFAWDAHDAAWNERLLELKFFYKRHGHCDVSISDANHQRLASWVKCQRRQYKVFQEGKESSLTPKRISKLNDLGFSWNVRDVTMR